jgi:hypothetical protein
MNGCRGPHLVRDMGNAIRSLSAHVPHASDEVATDLGCIHGPAGCTAEGTQLASACARASHELDEMSKHTSSSSTLGAGR